jgi:UDP-N-acetylmuramate dehydrogenase
MSTPDGIVVADALDGLGIRCETDVPLGPRTWYGVGGRARILAHPADVAQLASLASRCHQRRIPTYLLGSGANLLVTDAGVDGVVIQLDAPGFSGKKVDGNLVTVGAGYDLMRLVRETARAGLGGLEVVAGIPASVGGAVRMNAGGSFGEIGSTVRCVQVMSEAGEVYGRDRDDLVFEYRRSNITAPYILEVQFELIPEDPNELMRRVKQIFLYKKNRQPLGEPSAGCAFKNPPAAEGAEVRSAGQLIDAAGLKGFAIGGAKVSPMHANFVVVDPEQGTADDVKKVIEHVQKVVREQFGIALEREVVIWP